MNVSTDASIVRVMSEMLKLADTLPEDVQLLDRVSTLLVKSATPETSVSMNSTETCAVCQSRILVLLSLITYITCTYEQTIIFCICRNSK